MRASAPGKLILAGEYAVLDGAPALVTAVNRRATAEITAAEDTSVRDIAVHAPDLGIDAAGTLGPDGRMQWATDDATSAKLALIGAVLEAAAEPGPLDITVSTTDFVDGGVKLGLGSSAALTVALSGALAAYRRRPAPTLAELIAIHRTFQGGHGSGADIAASHRGGLISYTAGDHPAATPARLPDDITWAVVFTGHSASTAAMLAGLGHWRDHHRAEYTAAIGDLTDLAQEIARLCADPRPAGAVIPAADDVTRAIDAYADALDALGQRAGIDIMSADHRRLRNLARASGVIYKPSGAGGGDIGVAVARDTGHITRFRDAVLDAGYRMMDMTVDPDGVIVGDRSSRHPDREGR